MRRKGWKKIDEVDHELSGIKVKIYLRTSGEMMFDCEVKEDHKSFKNKNLNELKKEVYDYLDQRVDISWREVIEVKMRTSGYWRDLGDKERTFGFDIEHLYISQEVIGEDYLYTKPRGLEEYQTPEYMLKDAERWNSWNTRKQGRFEPPCKDGSTVYLPFDQDVWNTLERMQEEIRKTRARFLDFIMSQEGIARMKEVGAIALLEGPSDDENTKA